jgi:chromosome segregation ATPase
MGKKRGPTPKRRHQAEGELLRRYQELLREYEQLYVALGKANRQLADTKAERDELARELGESRGFGLAA